MSTVDNKLKSTTSEGEAPVFGDVNYMRKSASLINDSLHKGCDVIQMANGDIFITETKTVTFQYRWDDKKGKLARVNTAGRVKKTKKAKIYQDENA
ncbi:DUF2671 domain-containing protein [Rickettsiales endosymbiont of Stachyamoeba lipophora]|uniref:DUF2671 domain-containing protein n=1 Tax=Rickettsiales endosymbiont of Stachyamoeba lipophora TaxID=2486578 RepID=UPI000F650809|nr:DUF2671 domain-containing protein [Rickettsiales endosymbiont of Stachyamoeba lipophora]AZL15305.1 DUF2671 domain-containing protein [Rickettsiales endosymbiont of Stachyamoeba lipophora]